MLEAIFGDQAVRSLAAKARGALLERVDMELVSLELEPLGDDDFTAEGRLLWLALLEFMANPVLEWEDLLPPELAARVREWTQTPLPEEPVEDWLRDLLRTILWIREGHVRQRIEEMVKGVPPDRRFVYYLMGATGIVVVPLSGFQSSHDGFRITTLETDDRRRTWIYETVRDAIDEYVSS